MTEKRVDLKIETLEDAKVWIDMHHRWGIADAARMNRIEDRLYYLERPWWRRIFRRKP